MHSSLNRLFSQILTYKTVGLYVLKLPADHTSNSNKDIII